MLSDAVNWHDMDKIFVKTQNKTFVSMYCFCFNLTVSKSFFKLSLKRRTF